MPTISRATTWLPLVAILLASPARPARAQQPAAGAGRGATIEVTVHDSLAGQPLAHAVVQLVSSPDPLALSRSAETDARGLATFRDVPRGRYTVGFMHEVLDEVGIEAPVRQVDVDGRAPQRVTLGVPSAAGLRQAVCGAQPMADSSAAFMGIVRDPRDRAPVAGARVTAQWLEIAFATGGIQQRTPSITATSGPNGWFALCGLPAGTVMITARAEGDSTDRLEFQLQPREVRRRGLYVAAPGRARVAGRVVTADSAHPLAGARVTAQGGSGTVSDARGGWALAGVPLGTRMVEFRAVGYYPERRPVDVLADAGPVEVALSTFQAVLQTVRVEASRIERGDAGGFVDRQRRSGMGRFYSQERIDEFALQRTSDLLRVLPGFTGDGSLTMKGNFSDGAGNFDVDCTPEVYVDGRILRGISADELDAIVRPEYIYGIEVYSTGMPRPQQFQSGLAGCGALVIWQKPLADRVRRR